MGQNVGNHRPPSRKSWSGDVEEVSDETTENSAWMHEDPASETDERKCSVCGRALEFSGTWTCPAGH